MKLLPENLARYKEITLFLIKVGRSDLIRGSDLEEMLDQPLDASQEAEPEKLVAEIEEMGPTFIKLGQVLSTRADLISAPYLKSLARLQDKVEPFPFAVVEEILQSEIGVRISRVFSEFEKKPLAAASLGQVHRATMRDGRKVAVKVQRPEIRKIITTDLEIFEDVANYLDNHTQMGAKYRFGLIVDEFRRMILSELDYQREARNLVRFREKLRPFKALVIPEPIEDLTTSRVLTMEYLEGEKITALSPLQKTEINGRHLTEQMMRAYLHQILVDGVVHADPHPGNILLTPEGKLALIDLGMVGYFSEQIQDKLLRLLIHLSEGQADGVTDIVISVSEPLKGFDQQRLRRRMTDLVGEYVNSSVEDLPVGQLILRVAQTASHADLRLPSEFFLLAKVLSSLDEVGRILAPDFRPDLCIKRYALELFQQRLMQDIKPSSLLSIALDTRDFAEQLPKRINRILDNVGQNRLAIRVEGIDQNKLLEGFQKIANRITIGLVLAALIVGAATMMNIETAWTLFGYPAFAIALFLIAAGGGILLMAAIIYFDRKK